MDINFELINTAECYDVQVENEEGKVIAYTLFYHYEENVGWKNIIILNEEGDELPDGELKDTILSQFNKIN